MKIETRGLYSKKNISGYLTVGKTQPLSEVLRVLFENDASRVDDEGGFGEAVLKNQKGELLFITESSGVIKNGDKVRYGFWNIGLELCREIGFCETDIPVVRTNREQGFHWVNSRVITVEMGEQYKEVLERIERRKNYLER